ncbi:MAG: cation:proton antiporter [Alphaproteobacteria bacterium]
MPAYEELIPLAIVALVALICGLTLARLRQPAAVGYIVAGVVLGPSVLGLVENEETVALLAELGVLMLLFVIGMELSLRSFRRIWRIAVGAAALQILGTLSVMLLIGEVLGWPFAVALLLAFAVALSSTAVAIKMLEEVGELRTRTGRIAVGVLIAQDLAVVPMMLALRVVAEGIIDLVAVARIILSIVLLALLILFLSRRRRLTLPVPAVVAGHPDLMPLLGLVVCFGAATLSGLLGLSPAYGAFLAGLTIGNSNLRADMLSSTMPIQAVLIMVFFLSVGLLIDLDLIWQNFGTVLVMLLVVIVLKTVLNVGILGLLGLPWAQALLTGVVLAQVGEFSFLLAGIGLRQEIIEFNDFRLVITVTALSLAISPFWMTSARRLHQVVSYRGASARRILRLVYGREAGWVAALATETGRGIRRLVARDRNRDRAATDRSGADA